MDWSDVIRRFKDLRSLIDTKPVFRWGIITNADPLLVQLDGDDRPIAGSPSTIIGGLSAGKRVLCMVQNRRVTVIGRGGADAGGGLMDIVTFEYGGASTFKKSDYPGMTGIRVRLVGAGGAGGDGMAASSGQHTAGGGGGGGGYAESYISATALPETVSVSVGRGGRDISGGVGGAGGSTSFGNLVAATGGGGGNTFDSHNLMLGAVGGAGGSGTSGDIKIQGDGGTMGTGYATLGQGGNGGSSQLGGGGLGRYTGSGGGNTQGDDGGQYGGGGGGGTANASGSKGRGGFGADGVVIVEIYGW